MKLIELNKQLIRKKRRKNREKICKEKDPNIYITMKIME
jgi:hypothetical protein